ncbi:HD domain-containing protein [Saccharopolyspora shandongensis]|uniref:HD domain-containing protein n=1 Tax=Saccharopolyspora shandongensis TaxID=418495 RepID=UPI00344A0FE7
MRPWVLPRNVPRVGLVASSRSLAEKYLAESLPRRWRHVQGVGAQAVRIADAYAPDDDLLVAAALLHDIGYAPELTVTGFHPLDGARVLRSVGADERLCALVAHHSGARIEAAIRGLSDELAEFVDERTPVRDALWYCDMTTGPDGQRLMFEERIAEIERRYEPGSVTRRFLADGYDELEAAVQRTTRRLVAAGLVAADQPM